MALVIPRNVGGTADIDPGDIQNAIDPKRSRVKSLPIPADVGGAEVVPQPQPVEQPATPISELVPQAARAVGEAFTPSPEPEQQDISQSNAGIGEVFSGAQRIAANPELGTLPEFFDTRRNPVRSAAAQLGVLSTFDEKAQREIIKEQIPEAELEVVNGSTIISIPRADGTVERSVLNRPGLSEIDVGIAAAQLLAFVGPAKLASLGKSLMQKIGIGGAAAGATEQALQETGIELGREERDPLSTGIAAATGGVSEAVLPAIQAFRQGRQAKRLGVEKEALLEVKPFIEGSRDITAQTGIELAPAQQTLAPFAIEEQSFIASLPAAGRKAIDFLSKQNRQVQEAVSNFFEDLAPSTALQTGNIKARDAAKSVVQLTKDVRRQASKPFYKKAFKEASNSSLNVDVNPVLEKIDDLLQITQGPSKPHSELEKTFQQIQNSSNVAGESNLKSLHRAKQILSEKIAEKGEKGLDPTSKRDLGEIFGELKTVMEEASPGYRDAQRIFAQASGPVDDILVSKIGQVAKITDEKINSVSKVIFDEAITDPEVIKNTRKAIESIDEDAWAAITRVEAQRRLKNISLDVEQLTPDNAPAKIATALFGAGNKRDLLIASLNNGQLKNAIFLEDGLKRAAKGRPGGSQTGVRSVVHEKLKGVALSLKRLFNPVDALIATGEESSFNRNTKYLSEAIFNPKWEPRLSKIRTLKSDSPAAARAMTQLLNDINAEQDEE